MLSWHRKLHQVPESSPESQISYPSYPPTYPWLYGGSPPAPLPEPPTAPPTEPPTEPPMAPPTTVRSYPSLYGKRILVAYVLPTPRGPTPEVSAVATVTVSPVHSQSTLSPTSSPGDGPPPTPPPLPAPPPAPLPPPPPEQSQVGLIVGTVIGGLILLVVVGIFVIWYRRRNQRRPDTGPPTNGSSVARGPSSSSGAVHPSLRSFSYEELVKATDGFSKTNFRGEGGYGTVHEGVLPDGTRVAIKQLKLDSKQGQKEFEAEVEIISRVHHKNLVSLVGYCISGEHKILVYEFVPNGTLHFHLHGKEEPTIDWPTRMKIALGTANGLAYLHEDCHPKIIHRDIKTANILLDGKFEAKVADFGLAKFSSDTKSYVSTGLKGTWGYLDPAYLTSEKLTDKVDIFSFGVVLLELITGRVPKSESELLFQWAKPLVKQALENGNFDALIHPKLQKYDRIEMRRMAACAAACIRNSASNRPKMSQIVRALEGNLSLDDLNGRIKPGDSGEFYSYASNSYDTNQRNEDLKKHNILLQEDHKEDTNEQSEPSTSLLCRLHVEGEYSG